MIRRSHATCVAGGLTLIPFAFRPLRINASTGCLAPDILGMAGLLTGRSDQSAGAADVVGSSVRRADASCFARRLFGGIEPAFRTRSSRPLVTASWSPESLERSILPAGFVFPWQETQLLPSTLRTLLVGSCSALTGTIIPSPNGSAETAIITIDDRIPGIETPRKTSCMILQDIRSALVNYRPCT